MTNLLILGLPRGGLVVAFEVSQALNAPLDVFIVRKLGVPGHEELAMGAIASGGSLVIREDIVRSLGLEPEQIERIVEKERKEMARPGSSSRFPSLRNRPAPSLRTRWMIRSVWRRPSLFTGSGCGTRIFHKRPMRKSKIC